MIGAKASTMTGILAPIAASIPDITGIVATVGITGGIMAPTPDAIMIGAGAVITTQGNRVNIISW